MNPYERYFLVKPLTPKGTNNQIPRKSRISFCKILKNKWYHAKVLLKRFHLNGHTIGFHQQTQKLELHELHIYITDSGLYLYLYLFNIHNGLIHVNGDKLPLQPLVPHYLLVTIIIELYRLNKKIGSNIRERPCINCHERY